MLQTTFINQLPVLYILNIHCVTEYGTKVRVGTNNLILHGTNLANIMIFGIFLWQKYYVFLQNYLKNIIFYWNSDFK